MPPARDPEPLAPGLGPATPDAVLFVLRLGRALHTCGYSAPRLEEIMTRASVRLGLEGQFFTTPTPIFAPFGSDDRPRTRLLRVGAGDGPLHRPDRPERGPAPWAGSSCCSRGSRSPWR